MPIVELEVLYPFVWRGAAMAPRMRIFLENSAEAERLTALGAVRPVETGGDPPPAAEPPVTEPPAPAAAPEPAASEPDAVGRRTRRH